MSAATESRFADRTLDARGDRTDICPDCGRERAELAGGLSGLDLFYCEPCAKSTVGPNDTFEPKPEPAPEPGALFSVSEIGSAEPADDYEAAPIDEGMAWVADEAPDE